VLAAGVSVRAAGLRTYWLNPDEGIYYASATRRDFADFYGTVQRNAHPPLFSLLLRAGTMGSDDIDVLRAISLLGGTLSLAGAYALGSAFAGPTAGIAASALLAAVPPAIEQAQVLRPYSLLLGLLACALAGWIRAREGGGRRAWMAYSGFLSLALLTHYSAFLVFGGVLLVQAGCLLRRPRDVRGAVLSNLAPAAVAGFLFWSHIGPHLRGSGLQAEAQQEWLADFFVSDVSGWWNNLVGVFQYLSHPEARTAVLMTWGLAMLVALARTRFVSLFVPIAILAVATLASALGQHPFGGSRHSLYLAIVLIPPVAEAVAFAVSRRTAGGVAALVLLGGIAAAFRWVPDPETAPIPSIAKSEQTLLRTDLERLRPKLDRIRESPGLLLISRQTFYTLAPFFRGSQDVSIRHRREAFNTFPWGEREVLASTHWTLTASPADPPPPHHLARMLVAAENLPEPVNFRDSKDTWVIDAGWSMNLASELVVFDHNRPGKKLLGEKDAVPGLAVLQLNLRSYVRVLGF